MNGIRGILADGPTCGDPGNRIGSMDIHLVETSPSPEMCFRSEGRVKLPEKFTINYIDYIDYIVTSRREVKNTMASPVTPLLSGGSTINMLLASASYLDAPTWEDSKGPVL